MANISQIKVGDITYNIDAVTVGGKTYQEIINLVNTAQLVVCSTAGNTPKGVSFQSVRRCGRHDPGRQALRPAQ